MVSIPVRGLLSVDLAGSAFVDVSAPTLNEYAGGDPPGVMTCDP